MKNDGPGLSDLQGGGDMGAHAHEHALAGADDAIVAGRAADGDTVAFAVLVRRHTPMMRAYARQVLPGNAEVDDVVQEVWVTAWQRMGELSDPARVRSWLMRITGRTAIDRIRAARVHLDVDDLEPTAPAHTSPARIVEGRSGTAALSAALHELPDAQRACWVLREIGECSYEEIAEELDVSASTVRGLLARARKFLLVRMEEWR